MITNETNNGYDMFFIRYRVKCFIKKTRDCIDAKHQLPISALLVEVLIFG